MFGINTYIKQRKLKIDTELLDYQNEMIRKKDDLRLHVSVVADACAKDIGELEHYFHSAKEAKMIIIAKLEASEELISHKITELEKMLKIKDEEIKRLSSICMESVKHGIIIN